jgi:hypothetical protein
MTDNLDKLRHIEGFPMGGDEALPAGRLEAGRKKLERYYRQQEWAVSQIAIDSIRRAKRRELLEHRRADLAALDQRLTMVPDLQLIATAILTSVE